MAKERVLTSIRIPSELLAAYVEEANARLVSRNFLIVKALEYYLDVLDEMDSQ